MENEKPTFINSNMNVADVKNSERLMTLKNIKLNQLRCSSKWEQIVQQTRDELSIEQSSEVKPVHQKGILIEQGIMDFGANHEIHEVIGDCDSNGKMEGTIKQTRDVSVEKSILNAKYAHTKGILIEKGVLQDSNNELVQESDRDHGDHVESAVDQLEHIKEECVLQSSSDIKPSHLKEVLVEKGMLESWIKENRTKTTQNMEENCAGGIRPSKAGESCKVASSDKIPTEIAAIMNEINDFTACIDSNQDIKEWQQFRANLLTIHKYYMSQWDRGVARELEELDAKDSVYVGDIAQVELNIDDMMQPLNDLILRSKSLTNYIECIEDKINRLDFKVDHFYTKYNETLLNREKAYKDMLALQALRERIGLRLTHIEMEIHSSKTRLLQRNTHKK